MTLCPSPYNSFDNYKMASLRLSSTLKFSDMHSFCLGILPSAGSSNLPWLGLSSFGKLANKAPSFL